MLEFPLMQREIIVPDVVILIAYAQCHSARNCARTVHSAMNRAPPHSTVSRAEEIRALILEA